MNLSFVTQLISHHEGGFRATVYLDTKGNPTIATGFNLAAPAAAAICRSHGLDLQALLQGRPIPRNIGDLILHDQIQGAAFGVRCHVPNLDELPDPVQAVLVDMDFNMGTEKFAEFRRMIAAVNERNYAEAAKEMYSSAWYGEVKTRATHDVELMLSVVQV